MPHQCTTCGRAFADGSKEMLSGCPDCGGNKFQFSPEGFDATADGSAAGSSATETTGSESSPIETTGSLDAGGTADASESSTPSDRPGDAVSRTVGSAAATVRDIVGGRAAADATDARPPEPGHESATDPSGEEAPADRPDGEVPADRPDGEVPNGTFGPDPDALSSGFSDVEPGSDDDIIVAESTPPEPEDDAQADARSRVADPDELRDSEEADEADAGDADGAADRTVVEEPDAERADRPDLSTLRQELNEQFESIRVVEPGQYELNLMELYDREAYIIALQEDGRYSIQMPETWREADA